jgi:F-type H+-transporting ATPase subunit b
MLDISPVLLVVSAVIFLIVMVLLNNWLYQPLLKFMDDRDSLIKNDLENAQKNGADVEDLEKEAESIIYNAKAEASKIREKAINDAKEQAEIKISQQKQELEKEYEAFMSALNQEKVAYKDSLMASMSTFKDSLKAKTAQL